MCLTEGRSWWLCFFLAGIWGTLSVWLSYFLRDTQVALVLALFLHLQSQQLWAWVLLAPYCWNSLRLLLPPSRILRPTMESHPSSHSDRLGQAPCGEVRDDPCNSTWYGNSPLSPNFTQSQVVGIRAWKDFHRAVILPTSLDSSATTYHLHDRLEFQFFSERKQWGPHTRCRRTPFWLLCQPHGGFKGITLGFCVCHCTNVARNVARCVRMCFLCFFSG